MIDLLLGHSGALGGAQGPLLLLAPFVDEAKVLSVAVNESVIDMFIVLDKILTYESMRQACCKD